MAFRRSLSNKSFASAEPRFSHNDNLNKVSRNDDLRNSDNNKLFHKLKLLLKKKGSLETISTFEVMVVIAVATLAYSVYYYHDTMHFHLLRTYAWAGYDEAQQLVGQRYALGKGVQKHAGKAMEYFKMAADQGHPKASHNLALGHVMKHIKLEPGEARRLLNHASENGVPESDIVLDIYCDRREVCND